MTTKSHTFTGKTAGAAVATPEFDAIVGTAPTYVDMGGGDIGIQPPTTAVQSYVRDVMSGTTKVLAITMLVRFNAAPSAANEMLNGRAGTQASNAKVGNLLHGVSGSNPTLLARGGGDVALTGWTTATVLANGVDYKIELSVEIGTTTSNGRMRATLTRVSDGVVLASGEHTALNNGTATGWWSSQILKLSASGTVNYVIDDLTVTDELAYGTFAPLAADAANQAPVANAGPDVTVEAGSSVTLIGTDSDPDGTIATRAWSLAGSQVGTGSTLTFTAPVGLAETTRTYTYTVTDNAGASTSDTVVVTIRKALISMKNGDGSFTPLVSRLIT